MPVGTGRRHWYAAKAQMLARACHWEPVAALQLEYSLAERAIGREHVPAALDLGMGIVPWSPLANGLLAGKYTRGAQGEIQGDGRLSRMAADGTLDALDAAGNPAISKLLTERNQAIVASFASARASSGARRHRSLSTGWPGTPASSPR